MTYYFKQPVFEYSEREGPSVRLTSTWAKQMQHDSKSLRDKVVIIKEEAKEGWFVSFQTFGVHLPKVCLAVFFQEKKKKKNKDSNLFTLQKKKGELISKR